MSTIPLLLKASCSGLSASCRSHFVPAERWHNQFARQRAYKVENKTTGKRAKDSENAVIEGQIWLMRCSARRFAVAFAVDYQAL